MPKYSDGGRFPRVHNSVTPTTYGIQWPIRTKDRTRQPVETASTKPAPGRTRAQRRDAARKAARS